MLSQRKLIDFKQCDRCVCDRCKFTELTKISFQNTNANKAKQENKKINLFSKYIGLCLDNYISINCIEDSYFWLKDDDTSFNSII